MSSKLGQRARELRLSAGRPSRRAVVVGLSASVVAPFVPFASAATDSLTADRFLRASSMATGVSLNKSYLQLGEAIWGAILDRESEADKAEWVELINLIGDLPEDTSDEDLKKILSGDLLSKARRLAKIWYTGKIENQDNSVELITYDDALAWRVCEWTKPPATCGGKFGYWNKPYTGSG